MTPYSMIFIVERVFNENSLSHFYYKDTLISGCAFEQENVSLHEIL